MELAKLQLSSDNISIIVVFLTDPHQIATRPWPEASIPDSLDNMETAYDNSNGATFNNSNEVIEMHFRKINSTL